jgi:hypothetical protein
MLLKKYIIGCLTILAVIAAALYLFRPAPSAPPPKVVDAATAQNLKLVTFSDGTTQILYHDYDYAASDKGWDLSLTIPANKGDGRQQPGFIAPYFTFQGSNWQREVYTYNYVGNDCDNKILYINRAEKSAEALKTFDVPYCIKQTLDIRDFTRFFATSEDGKTVAVGAYEDGRIIASASVDSSATDTSIAAFKDPKAPKVYWPAPITSASTLPDAGLVAANWENTRLAFVSSACDTENGDTIKFMVWDTAKGTLMNKHASLRDADCTKATELTAAYDHDSDAFDIYNFVSGPNQYRYLFSVR